MNIIELRSNRTETKCSRNSSCSTFVMNSNRNLCWITFTILFCLFIPGSCSDDEERLVRDLFRDYNKLIRPVQNINESLEVTLGISFFQLLNVDEKNQVMKTNVWINLYWNDYQLKWDKAEYGGIEVLRIPPDKLWKPDIVLFNNADGNYDVRYKPNILVYSTGDIMWIPLTIFQSSCTVHVKFFPFDQQKCVMKFGSWTYHGDEVSFALEKNRHWADLSDYIKSGTWDIVRVPAYLNVYRVPGRPTQTDVSFHIVIRRKTLFYTVNLILPTVLISCLCVLVFYLPAEAGEKVTLSISILLSLVVFLLLVSKILPPTSLVLPLIAKYLLFTFIMNTVSILVTVIIINCNFRGPRTHRMSNLVRLLFLTYLPKFLFMKRPKKSRLRWMMDNQAGNISMPPPTHGYSTSDSMKGYPSPNSRNKFDVMELPVMHHPGCNIAKKSAGNREYDRRDSEINDVTYMTPEAHKAAEAIEFIADHLRGEDDFMQIREDWKYVAMVIDRLQLYIFFAVTSAGTIGILLNAPHIFKYVDQDEIIKAFSASSK
ncbi:nAChRb1 (predicted) [Pycnogonum litorale]